MTSVPMCFRGLLNFLAISAVSGYISWGNAPITRPHRDVSSYVIILPDPDLTASEAGHVFRVTLFVATHSDSFRIAILRPQPRNLKSHVVTAFSELIQTSGSIDNSQTIHLPAPLAYQKGDQLAFAIGDHVPCPYSLENPCRFYSKYMYTTNYGFVTGDTVNMTRGAECRRYSYMADTISEELTTECIPITFSEAEAAVTKHVGPSARNTPRQGYQTTDRTDMCWHVTCAHGRILVLAVIYYDIGNGSRLEISRSKNSEAEPLMNLFGTISSDTPHLTVRERHLYIRYQTTNNMDNPSGFDIAVYTEDDDGAVTRERMIITVSLAALASAVLIITVILIARRCRNRPTSTKQSSSDKQRLDRDSDRIPLELGYDNLMSTLGNGIEGKIPKIGYKADNTFLRALPRDADGNITGNNNDVPENGVPSLENDFKDLSDVDSEFAVINALEAVITGAERRMETSIYPSDDALDKSNQGRPDAAADCDGARVEEIT